MKSIFVKTLAAAAIASVCSANAATITALSSNSTYTDNPWPLVSLEGANLFTSPSVTVGSGAGYVNVTLTTGADYVAGDELAVTITGADVNGDVSNPSFDNSGITLLNSDTFPSQMDTMTFRVLSTIPAGTELVLSGVNLLLEADADAVIAASSVATAASSGSEFDAAASTNVAQVGSELAVSVASALDGVIDVEASRWNFVSGSTADTLALNVKAGADIFGVSAGKATVKLEGTDLEFMLDGSGNLDSGSYVLATNDVQGSTDASINAMNTEFSATTEAYYTTANSSDVSLTLLADGSGTDSVALAAQTFTADVDLGYSLGATTGSFDADDLAAGAWSLSGTTFNIPYLPFGSTISQIVYVSNSGTLDANIELTAFDDEGHTYGPVTLSVQAGGGKVTSLATAIRAALSADDDFDGTGRFDISLTINASSSDLDLFSAYNVAGDRLDAPNKVVSSN